MLILLSDFNEKEVNDLGLLIDSIHKYVLITQIIRFINKQELN